MNFKDKVVYQIYPKSYCDTNGDGIGDLPGIISKLDYLHALGVDYLWLNPIYPSPQRDNGYDVADYCAIDPAYGSMADFERLCEEAGKRGIHIMLDMVFNHTSTAHPWFQKALAGEEKYRRYYLFRPGKADGSAPTNWQSKFGGPAWAYAPEVGQYYLHLFDETQADLDWTNPDVRAELAAVVNFWRGKGVHGFRFDVINLISKRAFEDDPNHFDGRQYYTDGPHVHAWLQELNRASFGQDPDSFTVGEMSSTPLAACVHYAGAESGELSSVFTFHHLKVDYKNQQKWALQPFDFAALKTLISDWQTGMAAENAWNALFWNNHDQPRALSRFGNDREHHHASATMLASVLHCLRGTPYIYQGEEIGMTNAYFDDIDDYRDVESTNLYAELTAQGRPAAEIHTLLRARSRDNARTPMQWDDSPQADFSSGTPWLRVNPNYPRINAADAVRDPHSIYHHYRALIALRKQESVIQDGDYTLLLAEDPQIFAYRRDNADAELIVLANFYDEVTSAALPPEILARPGDYQLLLGNYPAAPALSAHTPLRPYEALIYLRRK